MPDLDALEKKSKKIRREVLQTVFERKEGHTGGAFSIVEILVSLFDSVLEKDDQFILSKGHACLPYFVLLKEKGHNPQISGHPSRDIKNGIPCTTGSLGHGLPIAVGMALSRKIKNKPGKIYVLMSDAECQEGTTWESAMQAAHLNLDNLVLIIDNNKLQTLGQTKDILNIEKLDEKFKAFNWEARRIDGHSYPQLLESLKNHSEGKPSVVVADTIKGKGVSFMEGVSKWHTMVVNEEELKSALQELEE